MTEKMELVQSADQKKNANAKKIIGFLAVLLGSILLLVTLFLPFASSTGEYREYLEKNPDTAYVGDMQMKNSDVVDISLLEFGRIYLSAMGNPITGPLATVCFIMISVFALFALMTTLFSILKKPIPLIIFDVLTFAVFNLIRWDFGDRGVMRSGYNWGMAQYFFYIGAALALAGAIVLLAAKSADKKTNMTFAQADENN